MFDFNSLKVIKENESNDKFGSFVGIRKHNETGEMIFTLPKGFNNFEINYDNVKNLFFRMYKTFKKFYEINNSDKNNLLDKKPQPKDNVQIENSSGYIFTDGEDNDVVLYSKIDLIENVIRLYQDLEIESIIQEVGLVEDVDYSKIEHMLERGVFLKNHAIFVEHDIGKRNIVRGIPSELIELYCYIYNELANELSETVTENIRQISDNFSYQHLNPEQSLFDEYSYETTISILKSVLDNIHKTTAYKNDTYWDIYDVVELFLYGNLVFDNRKNSQSFWGISNFSQIWEDMCNYTMFMRKDINILYCDTKLDLILDENLERKNIDFFNSIIIDKNFHNNFFIKFTGENQNKIRWIRPDIIFDRNYENSFSIQFLFDNKLLKIEEKSSDLLGISPIIDVIFELDDNLAFDKDTRRKSKLIFDAICRYFINNISNYKEKSKERLYEREQSNKKMRNLRTKQNIKGEMVTRKISNNLFIIKSINRKKYKEFLDDLLEQDKNKGEKLEQINLYDWKYIPYESFKKPEEYLGKNIKSAIIKQLLYEFCLKKQVNKPINNRFCIPYYQDEGINLLHDEDVLDCGIGITKVNFLLVQEFYLNA